MKCFDYSTVQYLKGSKEEMKNLDLTDIIWSLIMNKFWVAEKSFVGYNSVVFDSMYIPLPRVLTKMPQRRLGNTSTLPHILQGIREDEMQV